MFRFAAIVLLISAIPRPSGCAGFTSRHRIVRPRSGLPFLAWPMLGLVMAYAIMRNRNRSRGESSSPRRRRAPTTPMKTRRPSSRKLIRCPTSNLAEAGNSGAFAGAFILASGSRRRLSLPALDAAVIKIDLNTGFVLITIVCVLPFVDRTGQDGAKRSAPLPLPDVSSSNAKPQVLRPCLRRAVINVRLFPVSDMVRIKRSSSSVQRSMLYKRAAIIVASVAMRQGWLHASVSRQ